MLVKIEDGLFKVRTEYNAAFVKRAKTIQGKWKPPYWVFPEENEEIVRNLLLECYGEDGRIHETVVVDLELDAYCYGEDRIKVGDVLIASRRSRDASVTLADNAMLIAGGFKDSGGSLGSPAVTFEEGTVIRVKDLPVEIYDTIKDKPGVKKVDLDAGANAKEKIASLKRERESILKRLAEIDAALESLRA